MLLLLTTDIISKESLEKPKEQSVTK